MKTISLEKYGKNPEMNVTTKQNDERVKMLIAKWHLGPMETSIKPSANKEFWRDIAKAWNINEEEARNRLCANCEYFNNTPEMMLQMNKIPLNKLDTDGGGRGYCHEFDFICHNLRTCQAWERKDFYMPD